MILVEMINVWYDTVFVSTNITNDKGAIEILTRVILFAYGLHLLSLSETIPVLRRSFHHLPSAGVASLALLVSVMIFA